MTYQPIQPSTSPMARLRALSPHRGLDFRTALGIAERQASLLLDLGRVTTPPVSTNVIRALPHVELGVSADLPSSGLSYWTGSAWRLEANLLDALVRQRFTLAHELKHVIDHPGRDLFYPDHRTRERVADHFAACLLMPKKLLMRAWCSGEQNIETLADQFAVSVEAMTRRLLTIGLLAERPIRPIFCTRGRDPLRGTAGFAMDGGRPIRGGTP